MSGRRTDVFHVKKRWKDYRERIENSYSSRRRDQNQREGERLSSGQTGVRSRNEIVGRFRDRKQRLEYSKKEDSKDGGRIVGRELASKGDRWRNSRGHIKRDWPGEEKNVWRRNLDYQRQERSYRKEIIHHIAPRLKKYDGTSEVSRREGEEYSRSTGVERVDSLAGQTEEKALSAKECQKKSFNPVDFQRLILSKGFNRPKQVDTNRNVIWGEKVEDNEYESLDENVIEDNEYESLDENVIEETESESLDEETIFKDYSFKEYSGMLPTKLSVDSSSKDDLQKLRTCKRRLEQESDLESSDDDSIRRKLVIGVSRQRKFVSSNESQGRSRVRSPSIDGQSNNLDNTNDDDDIDDDYMISVMKNVVSRNAEGKRDVKLRDSSSDNFTSEDSEDGAETFKAAKKSTLPSSSSSPHLDHGDYSSHKPAPGSNISLKSVDHSFPNSGPSSPTPKVKTLNARFSEIKSEMFSDSHVEGKSYLSPPSLPSPRPASVTAKYDTAVRIKSKQGVGEREAKKVCPSSLYKSEAEQNQNKGDWKRSPDSVWSSVSRRSEVNQCQIQSSSVEMTVNQPGQTEDATSEGKVNAIPVVDDASQLVESNGTEVEMLHSDELSGLLTKTNIIFVDAENESEVRKEEKYEEPSPEIFEHTDLRVDTRYYPITRKMHNVVTSAMHNINEVVVSRHNIDITKHDLFTLTGDNWLNDKIVEMFLTMIAQRSVGLNCVSRQHPKIHSMSTYFFTNLYTRGYSSVKKWTKEVDIFSYDMVLIPIHMDKHWSLASIDFRVPGVFYYDSLGSTVNDIIILSALLHYLSDEHMDKKGEKINLSKFAKHRMDTPLQQNGSDCGVFCCKVGDFLSRDLQLKFCQDDIKYFRKRMIFEILKGVLLEP